MSHLRSTRLGRLSVLVVSSIVALAMVATAALFASTAQATNVSTGATTSAARTVAHTGSGSLSSRVVGATGNGRTVTGAFTPLTFSKKDGHMRVRGLIAGVVHNKDGSTRTFSVLRTMRVRSINGTPASARTTTNARATCDVLHLVLAPLDLDLLGLQVHLDRVVLDIVAVSGPGNLLGNLLCAVTGLLDDGLSGLLGRLTDLLNQILGQLGLGL